MMRPFLRVLVAASAAFASLLVFAFAASAAKAQVSSLEGEQFIANPSSSTVTPNCRLGAGTISFHTEGPAYGPYSGYFTEDGTVTFPGALSPASFQSTFTIKTSETGEVLATGTKTSIPGIAYPATCGSPFFETNTASGPVSYDATLETPDGTYHDTGDAMLFLLGVDGGAQFGETFTLSRSLLPVSSTGKATGGGQILDATSGQYVTFGFEVKSTQEPDQLQGRCNVIDQASNTQIKCLDVTDYTQFGNTATWDGTAEVDGVPDTYRITVQDNGEPNQGLDTFSITTNSGYSAAGPVEHGDVQIHQT